MRTTRKWRRYVKAALEAAPVNKIANSRTASPIPPPVPRLSRAATVASMERSGIEGVRQKFCAREVIPFVETTNPRKPDGTRRVPRRGGVATQAARHPTPNPTTIPLCQSLPQNGSDFSMMTNRLRPSSVPPTRSLACRSAPRFHFVASRLRLLARQGFAAITAQSACNASVAELSEPPTQQA